MQSEKHCTIGMVTGLMTRLSSAKQSASGYETGLETDSEFAMHSVFEMLLEFVMQSASGYGTVTEMGLESAKAVQAKGTQEQELRVKA